MFFVVCEKLFMGVIFGIKFGDVGCKGLFGFKVVGFWFGNWMLGGEVY